MASGLHCRVLQRCSFAEEPLSYGATQHTANFSCSVGLAVAHSKELGCCAMALKPSPSQFSNSCSSATGSCGRCRSRKEKNREASRLSVGSSGLRYTVAKTRTLLAILQASPCGSKLHGWRAGDQDLLSRAVKCRMLKRVAA